MNVELPRIIQKYVEASNQHDVESILACFADGAVVRDEGKGFRGKEMIRGWIVEAIEKYKFHFKPVSVKEENAKVVMAIEVSGTFPGTRLRPIITSPWTRKKFWLWPSREICSTLKPMKL